VLSNDKMVKVFGRERIMATPTRLLNGGCGCILRHAHMRQCISNNLRPTGSTQPLAEKKLRDNAENTRTVIDSHRAVHILQHVHPHVPGYNPSMV
jgi:hypothetical protein